MVAERPLEDRNVPKTRFTWHGNIVVNTKKSALYELTHPENALRCWLTETLTVNDKTDRVQ